MEQGHWEQCYVCVGSCQGFYHRDQPAPRHVQSTLCPGDGWKPLVQGSECFMSK